MNDKTRRENDTLSVCASSSFLNQRVAQIITEMQVEMTITNDQFLQQGVSGANFSHGCYFCSELLSSFMSLHSQMFQMVNCSNFDGKCSSIIILHGQRIIIPLPGSVFQLSNLDCSNSHDEGKTILLNTSASSFGLCLQLTLEIPSRQK